jgi:uncharacterized repeat protein (TIGR01451 family)
LGALALAVLVAGLVASAGAVTGGLKVDFAAAAPKSYDHVTGAGGVWGNTGRADQAARVESLEGGDFACGDKVVFFAEITGLSASKNETVQLDFAFGGQTTGRPGAGFVKLVSASANTRDPANVTNGNEAVSIEKQTGGHPSPDLTGTVQITNLGIGDTRFILRLVVELGCSPGQTPTGNVQARVADGRVTNSATKVNVGAQTINLKIKSADLAIKQNETVAPIPTGGDVVDHHILIIDHGPADATDVVLHDRLPSGTVIDSVTTDRGSCSISATELTCLVPQMDAGGTVDVNVITHETSADATAGSRSDATAKAAQFDPTPANNTENIKTPPPPSAPAPAAIVVDIHESAATVPLDGIEKEAITITNDGPGTATHVDITDALDAAVEVVAVRPGRASCRSSTPLICSIEALPDGASTTIDFELRPLRPGHLINGVSVSDDEPNALLAHDFAKTAATVKPRRTAARLRIVPLPPVARAGQMVEFVVIAGVTEPVPGVAPKICVTLPSGLRLSSAVSASATPSHACWSLVDLISGRPQSFRVSATVGPVPPSGVSFSVKGQLAGDNFTTAHASTDVQVPPSAVACPSSVRPDPLARIAC